MIIIRQEVVDFVTPWNGKYHLNLLSYFIEICSSSLLFCLNGEEIDNKAGGANLGIFWNGQGGSAYNIFFS